MAKKKRTQYEIVKSELEKGKVLTQRDIALKHDIWRLSHLIYVLRKEGMPIVSIDKVSKNGRHYVEYKLATKGR